MKKLELFQYEDLEKRKLIFMKVSDFDKKFDESKDIIEHLDISKAKRPNQEQKRVNVDFPLWMIDLLDREAKRLGVPRQSIIKIWVADRLEKVS
jgi:hypothetical protein